MNKFFFNINMKKVQAIILCAGIGNRLKPLTDNIPKSLVEVNGKTLLEYKLEILNDLVDEVIIVIGYQGDKIKKKFGHKYNNLSIKYCEQKELLGTGHAILQAKNLINSDKFIVLNGDDIYERNDIKNLLKNDFAILSIEVSNPHFFGVLKLYENLYLKEIIEKPKNPPSNLINVGCYVFNSSIFDFELKKSKRGEYEIIDYLTELVNIGKKIKVEKINGVWLPINDFNQLEIAKKYFLD